MKRRLIRQHLLRQHLLWPAMTGCLAFGCMLAPTNGKRVCGREAPVSFDGMTTNPGEHVVLKASPSRTGAFVPFADAYSTTSVFANYKGTALYRWSVSATVPQWSLVPTGSVAPSEVGVYVRAVLPPTSPGGTDLDLLTFDAVAPDGHDPVTCLLRSTASNAATAAVNCSSPDSPIIRLSAPRLSTCPCPTTPDHAGDLVIATDADANANRCVRRVLGNLNVINGPLLTDAVTFPALQQITGSATLDYATLLPDGTRRLDFRQISAPMLTAVGGDLSMSVNTSFASGGGALVDLGLPAVTTLGGNLTVRFDVTSGDFEGLNALVDGPHDVTFTSRSDVTDGLRHMRRVHGNLTLATAGLGLFSLMNALESVDGDLSLGLPGGNAGSGLNMLQTVGGDLWLTGFISPVGWARALTSVGGAFDLTNFTSRFTAPPRFGSPALAVGAVRVHGNPAIALVGAGTAGLANLRVAPGGAIRFTCNPMLPASETDTFVADQRSLGWTGTPIISETTCP